MVADGAACVLQYPWVLFIRILWWWLGLREQEEAGWGPCPRLSKREGISF